MYGDVKLVNVKQNGFAFVHFKKADAVVKVLKELDFRKYRDQIVFGKRADKKSVRKRDRGSGKKEKGQKKRAKAAVEVEPEEERAASLENRAVREDKRGKDAVWLSSDEEDLI